MKVLKVLFFVLLIAISNSCRKEQLKKTHVFGTFIDEISGKPIEGLYVYVIELYHTTEVVPHYDTLYRHTTKADGKFDFTFHGINDRYIRRKGAKAPSVVYLGAEMKIPKCYPTFPNPPSWQTNDYRYVYKTSILYGAKKAKIIPLRALQYYFLTVQVDDIPSLDLNYNSGYLNGSISSGNYWNTYVCKVDAREKNIFIIVGTDKTTQQKVNLFSREFILNPGEDLCETVIVQI